MPSVPIFADPATTTNFWPLFMQQVFIIIVLVKLCGRLLALIKQPPVIGEIMAGIIVGPSVLGQWNWWATDVFPSYSWNYFTLVGDIGLILFMFILGLELDDKLILKQWRTSLPIGLTSVLVPYSVGIGMAYWLYDVNGDNGNIVISGVTYPQPDFAGFLLFICSASSFTAFPVLASILQATRLITTPLGVIAISAAALEDLLAWCSLAIASAIAKGSGIVGLWVVLISFGYVVFQATVSRRIVGKIHEYYQRRDDEMNRVLVALIFLYLLVNCYFCELLGTIS